MAPKHQQFSIYQCMDTIFNILSWNIYSGVLYIILDELKQSSNDLDI